MRITITDATTKKPLTNAKVQLQVKGKDSGFLSLTTDGNGQIALDEKYKGQQIASTMSGGQPQQWITATDGATLTVGMKKVTETTSGGVGGGSHGGSHGGGRK